MRILDAVRYSLERLEKAGVDDPLTDAEMLVFNAARAERLSAYIDNPEIGGGLFSKIKRLTARRGSGEPLQYIIGHVEFCGLTISVGKGVLIPRPETELLVEEALKTAKREALNVKRNDSGAKDGPSGDDAGLIEFSPFTPHPSLSVLDLCTGSGCIALALAKKLPEAKVFGTDISAKALRYARKNAAAHNICNVTFKKGDLFGPLNKGARFDLIVSNPPYIVTSDIDGLQREIRQWEPKNALDGGADGLDFMRAILSGAPARLKEGGIVILELGYGQADEVSEMARQHGFGNVLVIDDFAGVGRILKAEKAPGFSN